MNFDTIIIRFGELTTKGKNRKDFVNKLAHSISRHLVEHNNSYKMKIEYDHIYLNLSKKNMEIVEILKNIQGLYSFSLALKITDLSLESLQEIALNEIAKEKASTFKVKTRRLNKNYPLNSDQINRKLATHILKNTTLKVDVHRPDILVSLEIKDDHAYLFFETIKGLGGYPEGSLGSALMMLSGGIDSPVASYLLLKRGIELKFIHFASPPYTNTGVIQKIEDILSILSSYQRRIELYIVPFTKIQEKIYEVSEKGYHVTIMRRMMYRIASIVANKHKILSIANGESVGQVASQTIASINVINKVVDLPIFRPLITYDKHEIINIAKNIGTYEISIRPYEDCCTIFPIIEPKTTPKESICLSIENKADFDVLIKEAVDNIEIKIFKK